MPRRTRPNFGHIRAGASDDPTVLDALAALERRDGKAGPRRPAKMSAATIRGRRRAPSSGTKPAPSAPVPTLPPVTPAPAPAAPAPVRIPRVGPRPGLDQWLMERLAAQVGETYAPPAAPVVVPVCDADPVSPGFDFTAVVTEAHTEAPAVPTETVVVAAPVPVASTPVAPSPVAASTVAKEPAEKRVLRLDTGFRVEEFSAILVMVLVFHASTWIGAMVGFGTFLPMAVAIGIPTLTVWGGLALIGGLGKVSLGAVRRPVIVAFTVVNVYGSFYAWNDLLAGSGAETEMARAAHRDLRAQVFAPVDSVAADAERHAVAAERKCEDESSQKRGGYGSRARTLCDEARDLRATADAAKAKRDALAPYFTDAVFALPAREMWDQAALAAGVANVPAPLPEAYYEVPLLRALDDLWAGKTAAIVALLAALLIDLAGILLGRGLHHRR